MYVFVCACVCTCTIIVHSLFPTPFKPSFSIPASLSFVSRFASLSLPPSLPSSLLSSLPSPPSFPPLFPKTIKRWGFFWSGKQRKQKQCLCCMHMCLTHILHAQAFLAPPSSWMVVGERERVSVCTVTPSRFYVFAFRSRLRCMRVLLFSTFQGHRVGFRKFGKFKMPTPFFSIVHKCTPSPHPVSIRHACSASTISTIQHTPQ